MNVCMVNTIKATAEVLHYFQYDNLTQKINYDNKSEVWLCVLFH